MSVLDSRACRRLQLVSVVWVLSAMSAILVALPAGTALAGTARFDLDTITAFGFDSNPLRLSGDTPHPSPFVDLAVDADVRVQLGERMQLLADAKLQSALYEQSNADTLRGELTVGGSWLPYRHGSRSLGIAFGGSFLSRRGTFNDRETGDVYETRGVPIPERFDADTVGVFANLSFSAGRKLALVLNNSIDHKDYAQDYESLTTLDRLDYVRTTIEPGVSYAANRRVRFEMSVPLSTRSYEDRRALDAAGDAVPGTDREYRYVGLEAEIDVEAADVWDFTFGVRAANRRDPYAGFMDYERRGLYAWIRRKMSPVSKFRLYLAYVDLDYANATTSDQANAELRGRNLTRVKAIYKRELTPSLDLFVEGAYERSDNQDAIYTYQRVWTVIGFRYDAPW